MGRKGFVFENLYIPLDAVSIVKLFRIADTPLMPYLIMAGVGVVVCISGMATKSRLFILLGLVALIYGGFMVYNTWMANKEKVYRIVLKLNNGESYTLTYGTLNSTVEVVNKIRVCIAEKNEAKNYFVNKGSIRYISDNSIGKIENNTFSGEVGNVTAGIGNTATVRENSPGGNDIQRISDREWVELARFFGER